MKMTPNVPPINDMNTEIKAAMARIGEMTDDITADEIAALTELDHTTENLARVIMLLAYFPHDDSFTSKNRVRSLLERVFVAGMRHAKTATIAESVDWNTEFKAIFGE